MQIMAISYNLCSILVVKRMGAEYMRGVMKKNIEEPISVDTK